MNEGNDIDRFVRDPSQLVELCRDVIEEMAQQLEGKLLPGDTVWRDATNEPAWRNNAKWERFLMTQDGVLRQGSPRGIWELGEDHP